MFANKTAYRVADDKTQTKQTYSIWLKINSTKKTNQQSELNKL